MLDFIKHPVCSVNGFLILFLSDSPSVAAKKPNLGWRRGSDTDHKWCQASSLPAPGVSKDGEPQGQ